MSWRGHAVCAAPTAATRACCSRRNEPAWPRRVRRDILLGFHSTNNRRNELAWPRRVRPDAPGIDRMELVSRNESAWPRRVRHARHEASWPDDPVAMSRRGHAVCAQGRSFPCSDSFLVAMSWRGHAVCAPYRDCRNFCLLRRNESAWPRRVRQVEVKYKNLPDTRRNESAWPRRVRHHLPLVSRPCGRNP